VAQRLIFVIVSTLTTRRPPRQHIFFGFIAITNTQPAAGLESAPFVAQSLGDLERLLLP
jgi:hypothetical protein